MWVVYCAMPERVRKPLVMPANSTIYRWNEIASALGHGTHVAVQQPANGFFLTDVERVVDKVLTRNLQRQRIKIVGYEFRKEGGRTNLVRPFHFAAPTRHKSKGHGEPWPLLLA